MGIKTLTKNGYIFVIGDRVWLKPWGGVLTKINAKIMRVNADSLDVLTVDGLAWRVGFDMVINPSECEVIERLKNI